MFPGNYYPKVVLTLQDEHGNPKEPGEWVINELLAQHAKWVSLQERGADNFINEMRDEAEEIREEVDKKSSQEFQYRVKHDIINFRKINNELNNRPVSDVTAGYQYKSKGEDNGLRSPAAIIDAKSKNFQSDIGESSDSM